VMQIHSTHGPRIVADMRASERRALQMVSSRKSAIRRGGQSGVGARKMHAKFQNQKGNSPAWAPRSLYSSSSLPFAQARTGRRRRGTQSGARVQITTGNRPDRTPRSLNYKLTVVLRVAQADGAAPAREKFKAHLRHVDLEFAAGVTDAGLLALRGCALETLNLNACQQCAPALCSEKSNMFCS